MTTLLLFIIVGQEVLQRVISRVAFWAIATGVQEGKRSLHRTELSLVSPSLLFLWPFGQAEQCEGKLRFSSQSSQERKMHSTRVSFIPLLLATPLYFGQAERNEGRLHA